MERGLYAAATGMLAQQAIQDTLANNLANSSTVGFKEDNDTFRAIHGMKLSRLQGNATRGAAVGELGLGVTQDQGYVDWQQGVLSQTNNPMDASLSEGQFFTVRNGGSVRYTRAGDFHIDAQGSLVTASGAQVLDINAQPITVKPGTTLGNFAIDGAGNLTAAGTIVAKLNIVQAAPNSLTKDGDTTFAPTSPTAVRSVPNPIVRPGTLEQSNVNTMRGLVQLISVSRSFDMAQRALTTQDDLMKHAANDLGHL